MKQVLDSILTQLQKEVPHLQYVDENWGQLEFTPPPVKFSCALIDFESGEWSDKGALTQIGIGQISITVANVRLSNSSGKAPARQRDKVFEFYDLIRDIFKALHGFQPTETSGVLTRKNCMLISDERGIKIRKLIFNIQLNDNSAMPERQVVVRPTVRIITD